MKRKVKDKGPKWSVSHLPVGTTFLAILPTANQERMETEERDFTVNHTTRNGHRSFIVVCEPEYPDDPRWPDPNLEVFTPPEKTITSFNINHITRILKRGDGGPSFREQPRRFARAGLDSLDEQIEQARAKGYRINTTKQYVKLSLADVVRELMTHKGESTDPGEAIHWKKAIDALYAQSFVKKIEVNKAYYSYALFVVDKKKAKAWYRRNHRRCMANIDGFIKDEEKRLKQMWDKELEAELKSY